MKLYEVLYMKCPHCDKEILGVTCLTGSATEEVEPISAADEDDNDFEDRTPCSDGNCIGIIIGGKCNICGKPHKAKKK